MENFKPTLYTAGAIVFGAMLSHFTNPVVGMIGILFTCLALVVLACDDKEE